MVSVLRNKIFERFVEIINDGYITVMYILFSMRLQYNRNRVWDEL